VHDVLASGCTSTVCVYVHSMKRIPREALGAERELGTCAERRAVLDYSHCRYEPMTGPSAASVNVNSNQPGIHPFTRPSETPNVLSCA
jgi:hypothetical protein